MDAKLFKKVAKLKAIVEERNVRYQERFQAAEDKVTLALAAQKELSSIVAAASEKAIQKAEEAQRSYNERSNEFRAQLGDQNKIQMPRIEADSKFLNIENKIDDRVKGLDSKIEEKFKTVNTALEEFKQNKVKQGNFELSTVLSVLALLLAAIAAWYKSH